MMSEIRHEYARGRLAGDLAPRLAEDTVPADPFVLFTEWLAAAIAARIHEPNGMTLATADAQGRPSARTVLLKDFDSRGFCFYTNYTSRKGQELAANPWAALLFWWGPLERQVRIEGRVEKLTAAESDAYFHSRPLGARLGAWVSEQSTRIPDRAYLEARLAAVQAEYAGQEPPRPPHWGGYRVRPALLEFWQGGPNRLHDRLVYQRAPGEEIDRDAAGAWEIRRLAP